ncbi:MULTISPECIES: phosphopantetheine-binding protein [Kitasatospora]|uniref:Putative acyl carrier protein n=1 Tax=Kitasatospora setae (strain ATCC 33774 / DSM 43861 / JCM 3304 / KCC A-0304 / NBRC 14216 / KM-6054) TaxID=452652 RepID=E4NBG4_KITSK|nr:phosphopantetheine-binding protein [Kitasatospora setae]BAJ28545.1 putative acyl carrier protein [Kitasatospora setae KM-6054]
MFEEIKAILVHKLKVTPEQVTPEATREDIELDSLAVVELSLVLETEFGVSVTDDELLDTETIGEMAELVESRMSRV